MAVFQKFNNFVADMANKIHNLSSDTLMVALTTVAPVATNHVLTDITEISYTNCSSRVITTTSSSQIAGVYRLILADLTLTASGGSIAPFQYIVIYNNVASVKNLIGFFDYGAPLTLSSGQSLIIDFDNVNGVFSNT